MRQCASCGTVLRPIRDDGDCWPCHIRGIGFTFGGPLAGRAQWNETTTGEFVREHVGVDNIRSGAVERAH